MESICQDTVIKWKTCPGAAGSQMMSRFSNGQQGQLAPFKEMRNPGGSGQGRGWWRDPVGS